MKINLHNYLVLFYCLPYNTLYHLRDWSHRVERFALSECILLNMFSPQSSMIGKLTAVYLFNIKCTSCSVVICNSNEHCTK